MSTSNTENYKITIAGSGYVGMSLAVLLAQNNFVKVFDIDEERIKKINQKKSTIVDKDIDLFLSSKSLNLIGELDKKNAFRGADFIIVATPTNYDELENNFDTSSVDQVVSEAISINADALIVIKSTLPIGHVTFLRKKFNSDRIIFSPEFLREGMSLKDNLYPSRIIIGGSCANSKKFGSLMKSNSLKDNTDLLFMDSTEAEAVKLFANTYLAMRVSFFNEIDTYALSKELDIQSIIK